MTVALCLIRLSLEGWRRRRAVAALVMLSALAACSTEPPPPLMSPLQFAKFYGYADIPIGDNRYQVTYVGPNRRSLRSFSIRLQVGEEERTQVFDFALWRAAQIAEANRFPAFRISNVRTNMNTYTEGGYDPFGYGPGFFPRRYPGGPYWGSPYWGPSPYAYQQADVTMDVELLRAPGPGDYLARDVIERLRRAYPGAEGFPVPNAPPPSGGTAPAPAAPQAGKAPAT